MMQNTKKKRPALPVLTCGEAAAMIRDGDRVMVGGFGLRGSPSGILEALAAGGAGDLTVLAVNCDAPGVGLGKLLRTGQITRLIGSYFNKNPEVALRHNAGELEVELLPMGTFAEALRAGGMGIPAFYVPAGAGTELGEGAETREFDGRSYLLQRALRARVALIRARRADTLGNLVYSKTARNFNPAMAAAADFTIAEVEEIVEPGELDPDSIVTSHIYVIALVRAEAGHE